MAEVVLELFANGWNQVGSASDFLPPGSISSEAPGGRQVFIFGWLNDGRGPGVWRSVAGVDAETAAVRMIVPTKLERLADLIDGPYELEWWRDGRPLRVRFRHRG